MVVAMTPLERSIADRKRELDRLRPLSQEAPRQLQTHQDVELTYTSNAIEGNALTLRETAEVIEHGITVGGKPLRDHLEALDQYEAVLWVREIASAATPVGEATVVELHRRIVARSQPSIADAYSSPARRVAGSAVVFPNRAKIPISWRLSGYGSRAPTPAMSPPRGSRPTGDDPSPQRRERPEGPIADEFDAGPRRLPSIPIRPEDRASYLAALEKGHLGEDPAAFQAFMAVRLNAVMGEYLRLLGKSIVPTVRPSRTSRSCSRSRRSPRISPRRSRRGWDGPWRGSAASAAGSRRRRDGPCRPWDWR